MNITITLIGQMITFLLFVWFTMRYVWPPITKALQERQARIAEGLAAAERGHHDLELAQQASKKQIKQAKNQGASIIEDAKKQADLLIEAAKVEAREQAERLKVQAEAEIEMMFGQAKEALGHQATELALVAAEKILISRVNDKKHHEMVDDLIKGL